MTEKTDGWKEYEGKTIFLKLRNGREYTGKVYEVNNTNLEHIIIKIIDKFGRKVGFYATEIAVMEAKNE